MRVDSRLMYAFGAALFLLFTVIIFNVFTSDDAGAQVSPEDSQCDIANETEASGNAVKLNETVEALEADNCFPVAVEYVFSNKCVNQDQVLRVTRQENDNEVEATVWVCESQTYPSQTAKLLESSNNKYEIRALDPLPTSTPTTQSPTVQSQRLIIDKVNDCKIPNYLDPISVNEIYLDSSVADMLEASSCDDVTFQQEASDNCKLENQVTDVKQDSDNIIVYYCAEPTIAETTTEPVTEQVEVREEVATPTTYIETTERKVETYYSYYDDTNNRDELGSQLFYDGNYYREDPVR